MSTHTLLDKSTSCVVAATAILGDKWTPLIINALHEEPLRFCHLQEKIGGVNPRTLSARLDKLEEHMIVQKIHVHDQTYSHYCLSPKGQDLLPIIVSMTQWGEKYPNATSHN